MMGFDGDIIAVEYGDIPSSNYTQKDYDRWQKLSGTLSNIGAVDAHIFTCFGQYSVYNTRIGKVYIDSTGDVLCGSISIRCRGNVYNVYLNLMHNLNGLDVIGLRAGGVVGYSNKDGLGSPSRKHNTREISVDVLESILNDPLNDYGEGIQRFMDSVRKSYLLDKTNHIMEKTFDSQ